MTWKEEIISLSSIDIEDHTFRITTEENIESLSCSIKNAGLINPPIVIEGKSGYAVISGFRRIRAVQKLGWSGFTARVLDKNADRYEFVKLAITDNLLQRSLNLIELSRCYKLLSVFFKKEEFCREASLIGLPGNPAFAEKIMRLSDLPAFIQNCVVSETVSIGMALELGAFEHETGVAFAKLFNELKPSLNKQREIVSFSSEIALRENIPIANLINGDDFRKILSDENSDRNLKIRIIRDFLKARRFPAIMKYKDSFEKRVKKLELSEGMKLIPPSGFEGNTFILNIEFKKTSDLEDQVKCLKKMINNPVLTDLLSKQYSD